MATEVAGMTAHAEDRRPEDERPADTRYGAARRKAARYAVPAAVVGVTALTVGLVPALADSGDPDLPELTAHQLVAKLAGAHEEHFSGTVRVSTDLGLPGLDSAALGGLGGAAKGSGGDDPDPRAKLTELASGTHTLRLAADGPERQRLSILEDAAEYSVIRDGARAWAYDSASDKAVRLDVPRGRQHGERSPYTALTPQELADQALKAAARAHTSVRADGTAHVAGRDAYQLVIAPKQSGSTVEAVRILVDAKTGTPLRATLTAREGGKPVIEAGFTKVSFTAPEAKTFSFTPPKGTEITEPKKQPRAERQAAPGPDALKDALAGSRTYGEGWTTVARLDLPAGAGGLAAPKAGGGQAGQLLDSFAKEVKGSFGTGRLFSTRLVNVLLTEDGHVYAGAVTKDTLVKAAESEK
ncbi:LolA family protein [Streptomyces sp. NRRL F-5630]|uniref:LolA family protein n=1 Tax=Streptomyces sp. NRRL F-5630 TaxID=1463864 RepID=UPI0004C4ABF3|nr:sigma-E factor regulatory protein RseB domain-containing protein [Streptomyces sp. NRRL F-5630]